MDEFKKIVLRCLGYLVLRSIPEGSHAQEKHDKLMFDIHLMLNPFDEEESDRLKAEQAKEIEVNDVKTEDKEQ